MFKIILSCSGVPEKEGITSAADIADEFALRPWHRNVECRWEDGRLVLQAENDFDADGKALLDEFSDAMCACLSDSSDGEIKVESVSVFDEKKKEA